MAILNALVFIFNCNSSFTSYVIFTDSVSSLSAIKKLYPSHQIAQDIKDWLVLIHSRRKIKVELCWVPSHVGIGGNEQADLAAKSATSLTVAATAKVPHGDFKRPLRSFIMGLWQNHWSACSGNLKLKAVRPMVSQWRPPCLLDRRSSVVITRLRIGHTHMTHGYLMASGAERQVPLCPTCQIALTVKHILIECPAFLRQRRALDLEGKSLTDLLGEDAPLEDICILLKNINLFYEL